MGFDYTWAVAVGVGALALYWIVPKIFGSSDDNEDEIVLPKYKRLPVGKLSLSDLAKYKSGENERILVSVCGRIFDVTSAPDFYNKGEVYECFTGSDATYMLGALSLNEIDRNKTDFEQDGDHQITLSEWIAKYRSKYPFVGLLNDDKYIKLAPNSWREAGFDDIKSDINNIISFDTFKSMKNVISVCGIVFNIKNALMVYDEYYGDFADTINNDITYCICIDNWDKIEFNKSIKDIKLNDQQQVTIIYLIYIIYHNKIIQNHII